jgi:hypothetical protein
MAWIGQTFAGDLPEAPPIQVQLEMTLDNTLQCLVVELELQPAPHDCGPDCPCWGLKREERNNFHPEAVLTVATIKLSQAS